MLTNHCMYLQWYLELLSASCGFNSRREHRFFAAMIVKIHCCFFYFMGLASTEKTKRAPRTKSIQAPNGNN